MPRNWCFQTIVLEETPESLLDSTEIKPVNLKVDQPWILTGRTDAEAEVLVLWTQYFGHANRWLIGKSLMLGKIRGRGEENIKGWDGWMLSPMQWTWTWANSGRWWGTGRPSVLPSMGSQRVRHDWATEQQPRLSTSLVGQTVKNLPTMRETRICSWVGKIPWRREWLPTPVFLSGEPHGQRSLVSYSLWGCKELDTTEGLTHTKIINSLTVLTIPTSTRQKFLKEGLGWMATGLGYFCVFSFRI